VSEAIHRPAAPAAVATPPRAWSRVALRALGVVALLYLPMLLTERAILGVPLSNMQLLNLGLTQINLMLIAMLGALSLNYLTGCCGTDLHRPRRVLCRRRHGGRNFRDATRPAFPDRPARGRFDGRGGRGAGRAAVAARQGLYFVLSTMAIHYLVNFVFLEYQFRVFDVVGIPFATPSLFGWELNTPTRWYFFLLVLVGLVYAGLANTLRTREGRALLAMRDHERAAASAGVDVRILRIKAFGLTSAIAGMAGALYAYYLSNATAETFGISFAIQFIAMIIIGGMGSLKGSLIGAAVWLLLPSVISGFAAEIGGGPGLLGSLLGEHRAQLVQLIFGLLVVALLIFAPGGLASLGGRVRGLLSRDRRG
jgi:branched-chain amino acid transport system permease protein